MSVDALLRLKNTVVYQMLLRSEESTLAGDHQLSELCVEVVSRVAPLLERIPEKLPEFTLHDPNHSAKILDLIGSITPQDTLEQLNAIELAILILSAYLHDIGMTCTSDERDSIIAGDSTFSAILISDDDRATAHRAAIDAGQNRLASRIEDQVFVEYLRRQHVERTDKFIEDIASLLTWRGTPFAKWVRLVCKSHGGPASALANEVDYPRDALIRNLRVNIQYLSTLLRLADILDLDPERTPTALFEFINPTDATSIQEWHKHRSIVGWAITPERVVFEAECTEPAYERALRTFIEWIEDERRESLLLLGRHDDAVSKRYRVDLVHPVTTERIRSNGSYIYSSMRFIIDHKRVMNLLGGVRLYKDPLLAIRELLQNAADAVRHRQAIDADFRGPSIRFSLEGDTLVIEDNGIGMDEYVFREYFIQLGRSFYTSPEYRVDPPIDAVSEFGIGALASFMIATTVTVESRRLPTDPLKPPTPVLFEIPTASDFFVQRPSSRTTIGTTITLKLRTDIKLDFDELADTVRQVAPMLELPIGISSKGRTTTVQPNVASLSPSASTFADLSFPLAGDPILQHVDGDLHIRHEGREEAVAVVAQRGFLIGSRRSGRFMYDGESESVGGLLPDWTRCVARLNLRGDAKLTVTPDRRGVVQDSRFYELKTALDHAAVTVVRDKIRSMSVGITSPSQFKELSDDLLAKDILRGEGYIGFTLSAEARALIEDVLYVEVIAPDSTLTFVQVKDLLLQPDLVITSRADWPEGLEPSEIRKSSDQVTGRILPIVVRPEQGTYSFDRLFEYLYGDVSSFYITHIAGLVFDGASKGHRELPKFGGRVEIAERLVTAVGSPVLVHSAAPTMVQNVQYNPDHPLIRPFIDHERQALSESANQLMIDLDDSLNDLLGDAVAVPTVFRSEGAYSIVEGWRGDAMNKLFSGFLKRHPEFVSRFEDAFMKLWEGGIAANLVARPFPGFTTDDLPWFWS